MSKHRRKHWLDEEHVNETDSHSTIISGVRHIPPKFDKLVDTKVKRDCFKSNNRAKKKLNWKRLLSYLPSWIRNITPANTDVDAASKENPPAQIGQALVCTPKQSGHQLVDHGSIPKRSCKKSSHERVFTYYNFQERSSDTKTFSERWKQKIMSVCDRNSARAEVSAGNAGRGNTSNYSCSCSERRKKQPQKCLVDISPVHSGTCQQCIGKQSSTSSACRKSIIKQAWAYIQELITDHKRGCQRCNQRRSCPNSITTKSSNDSQSCKESLLELALAYLKKISSDHKTGCQRCKDKESYTNPIEMISYLRSMLEQAWVYLPTVSSAENCCKPAKVKCVRKDYKQSSAEGSNQNCCQSCQQLGLPVCCKHSSAKASDKDCCQHCKKKGKLVCCKHSSEINKHSGILKYPSQKSSSHTTCGCSGKESSEIKKPTCPDNVGREFKSCPRLCRKKSSQESVHKVPACKSAGNVPDEYGSYVPYCKYSSHGAQPLLTASNTASCSSFQSLLGAHKYTACKKQLKKQPSQFSIEDTRECSSITRPCKKCSSQTQEVREILGYHSSTECSGPCAKDDSDEPPKQGLSLTIEPHNHKFCTRPKSCKHSKQALENDSSPSASVCGESSEPAKKSCTGACNKDSLLRLVKEHINRTCVQDCSGGCSKCNSKQSTAAPMYQEQRMVDTEYGAFLDEKFGIIVKKEMLDKETLCENDCDCETCMEQLQPTAKPERKADPYKYRFYY